MLWPGDIDGSGALLAGDSVNLNLTGDLTNAGGTIAGRKVVSLTAQNIDNLGGRITGQDVSALARDDLNVIGGRIDAQNSLKAEAGRDLNVVTTTRSGSSDSGAVQLSASAVDRVAGLYVTGPGGTLTAQAGRDLATAGAQVASAGSATLVAGQDVTLATVTTGTQDAIRWSSRNSRSDLNIQQTGTSVSGGTDVTIQAGGNLSGTAATLSAGNALSLEAKGALSLDAGQNEVSSQTQHSQRSGMSRQSLDTTNDDTTLARTTLSADTVTIRSGGNTTLSAVDVNAGSLDVKAGGKLILGTQRTTNAASVIDSNADSLFVSNSSSGHVDQTTNYNRFNVGSVKLSAAAGVTAQVAPNTDLAMLAQQPGMGWVNQLLSDPALVNSTNWQQVQEAHQRWSEQQDTLGPVSSALVMLVVGVATAGAGASAVGSATGMSATSAAAAYPAMTAAIQAGITSLASQATISTFNNAGDLGKVFDELASSESLKNLATSMVTAGALQGLSTSGLLPENLANATNGTSTFVNQLQRQLIDGATTAVIRSAVNGTSLGDNLAAGITSALINTAAAQGASAIGTNTAPGSWVNLVAHAIAGCAEGAARTGNGAGCSAGSIGGVIGEMTALTLNGDRTAEDIVANGPLPGTLEVSSLMSGLAVAIAGGDATQVWAGAATGFNAAQNNQVAQVQFLAQTVQRFGQVGWQGLTAEAQALLMKCAASTWCSSLGVVAAAMAFIASPQFAAVQPTGAAAIPGWPGSEGKPGTVLPTLGGTTVSPARGTDDEVPTTTTPGTALTNAGTPGYAVPIGATGSTTTTTPIGSQPEFPVVMMNNGEGRVTVLDASQGSVQISFNGQNGHIEVIADISRDGDRLILSGLHIEGVGGSGSSSVNELRELAVAIGAAYGASEVTIQGGTRTSGANPGRTPTPRTIKVPR